MFSKISKYFTFSLYFFSLLFIYANSKAQQTQTIKGRILEDVLALPIEKATISIDNKTAFSDNSGYFEISGLSTGRKEIKVSCIGFKTLILKEVLLESGKELDLSINLSVATKDLDLVQVKAVSPILNGSVSSIETINMEQVFRYPATFFDPARLAFSFAGVSNANDQANAMVVRGNSPNTLQWRLEGVEIVNPNHLSNAGTLSDGPSQSAGGTNMLSAQLLGNMNFLLGAYPTNYGNAIGGIMDMGFRNGNSNKREHTIQTGLIGIDLSTEGPFTKKSKTSYLLNYRYSFTGILGLMGIDFGGESIKFQDFSANIYVPTKKLGDFSFFGISGTNANIFKGNKDEILSEKDLQNINFNGKTYVVGMRNSYKVNANTLWKNVLVYSSLDNTRNANRGEVDNFQFSSRNNLQKSIFSWSSILNHKLSESSSLRTGLILSNQITNIDLKDSYFLLAGQTDNLIVEPFLELNNKLGEKVNASLGVHYSSYSATNSKYIEPRFSVLYDINNTNSLAFNYGFHSQQQLANYYILAEKYNDSKNFGVQTSNQFVLSYKHNFLNSSRLKAELYYLDIDHAIASTLPQFGYFSSLNVADNINSNDELLYSSLNIKGAGRNYGLELSYQKLLDKGWFYNINATIYNSQFQNIKGEFVDGKFSGKYISNIMFGKEWDRSNSRILGVNTRLVYVGGYRDYQILLPNSEQTSSTVFDYGSSLSYKNKDYFRPDLRVYFKKSKAKYSRTISIDLQNFAGIENEGFRYYDSYLKKIVVKNQLGLIPMFNYKWEF